MATMGTDGNKRYWETRLGTLLNYKIIMKILFLSHFCPNVASVQKISLNKTFTEIRIKQPINHLFEGNFLFNFTKTKTNGFCWHTNGQFWIKITNLAPFTNCSSPFCES